MDLEIITSTLFDVEQGAKLLIPIYKTSSFYVHFSFGNSQAQPHTKQRNEQSCSDGLGGHFPV